MMVNGKPQNMLLAPSLGSLPRLKIRRELASVLTLVSPYRSAI